MVSRLLFFHVTLIVSVGDIHMAGAAFGSTVQRPPSSSWMFWTSSAGSRPCFNSRGGSSPSSTPFFSRRMA